MNSVLFATFAGTNVSGIFIPFPVVAVSRAERSNLESLKLPS